MNKPKAPILIVDDEDVALAYYSTVLEGHGIDNFTLCQDSRELIPLLSKQAVSIILLDLNMPHISGQDLLKSIKEEYSAVPVVVITAEDSVETAVQCMKMGAFDYLAKPVDRNRLITVVKHALEIRELQQEVDTLSERVLSAELIHPEAFKDIVGQSEIMRSIFRYIEAIAGSPKSVLITGESGTGKELIARAIHNISRSGGQFVPVNVSGLDDTIFSDTLFGHKKGAFTGADSVRKGLIEQAAEGILFLDEIGDLEMGSQIKLLRLLQEEEYYPLGSDIAERSHARIIAATNANLKEKQELGNFRKDLYYRLMTHNIKVPPLRERMDDLPFLIDNFLEEASKTLDKKKPTVPKELCTFLSTYNFPGNIRELQSMVFDAVSRHKSGILSLSFFKEYIGNQRESDIAKSPADLSNTLSYSGRIPTLKEAEDFFIGEAVKKSGGNQSVAAQLLGISQSTLSRRLSENK